MVENGRNGHVPGSEKALLWLPHEDKVKESNMIKEKLMEYLESSFTNI